MNESIVRLSVPAEASFARSVRMLAANLAVCCDMSVDDVEDIRMAAEEGFVYACATMPDVCAIAFALTDGEISMSFSLGDVIPEEADDQSLDLVELLLSAVSDDFGVNEDGTALTILMKAGTEYDR